MLKFSDLREHYLGLLLEDRIDFLKQHFKDISAEHDDLAKHKTPEKIIDHFAKKADPTTGKAYTQWLLQQYKNKAIRQEDAPQLKSTLTDFERTKGNLEKKDIGQYSNVGEVRDAIATQKGTATTAAKAKEALAKNKSASMEKLYDHDGVYGFKIPNRQVSQANYGPGGKLCKTSWCTAANSSHDYFNHYKGGKYTMHFPNGEVLQFHHQSGQLKDKNDVEIGDHDSRFAPYAHHISKFIHQTAEKEGERNSSLAHRFHTYTPEEIDTKISDYEKEKNENGHGYRNRVANEFARVASKAKMTSAQLDKMRSLDSGKDDYNGYSLNSHLLVNPNLPDEEMKKEIATRDKKHGDAMYDNKMLGNPALKGENLNHVFGKVFGPEGRSYGRDALTRNNPNLQASHIDHILSHGDGNMLHDELAANHGITLSKEHQEKILKDTNTRAHRELSQRSDIHPDVVNKMVEKHPDQHANLIANPNVQLSKDHINKILNHEEYKNMPGRSSTHAKDLFDSHHTAVDNDMRHHLLDHMLKDTSKSEDHLRAVANTKAFNKEHLQKLLDKKDLSTDVAAAGSHRADSDTLHTVLDRNPDSASVKEAVIDNKKVKPDHLKKILGQNPSESHVSAILQHPAANSEVLHTAYDNGKNTTKSAILHHPAVQVSHFNKAMDEPGMKLHGAISSSSSAPPSILHKMSESPLQYVRNNVATNKNTSQDTLKNLAQDSDPEVSTAAKKRYKGA